MSPVRGPIFGCVTGLIYLVIIALWAAVLIPMWLRRHDQISEVRSTARFSSAMRSLSRADDPEADLASRSAADIAARRRSIVLAVSIVVVLTGLVAAFAGAAPKWLPIVLASFLAAYLVAAAVTAPSRAASARMRASRADAVASLAPVEARRREEIPFEEWDAWDEDDDSWAPVPATIPTYVNAPRATAVARPIDHAAGGVWSGSAMVEAAQEMREYERAAVAPADARTETAEIPVVTERARAASE